jgi:glycosyltransferase involved in cell wall biosynthesis
METVNSREHYPRILVVSNNPFSNVSNNGKTLASFFDQYPADKIAQLYFHNDQPDHMRYSNYFRITDHEMLQCFLKKRQTGGSVIMPADKPVGGYDDKKEINVPDQFKSMELMRGVREYFWKEKYWNSIELNHWMDAFAPQVIFFCAGNCCFTYNIVEYIHKKYATKLIIYITDDYVLPRKTLSIIWWYRRNRILGKMKNSVLNSDLFITISKNMKDAYCELLGKDSILAVNMSDNLKDDENQKASTDRITLVYAGGLHYKRYITLGLLAKALKHYNDNPEHKIKAGLDIYSTKKLSNNERHRIEIEGVSRFCGVLNRQELKKVLNRCDIPVHAESFDHRCIEATRLSISTKIPEYLSLGKPILAIGPDNIASMEYLQDCAFCITDPGKLFRRLSTLLEDSGLRKELSDKALTKYRNYHQKDKVSDDLLSSIMKICMKGEAYNDGEKHVKPN